MGIKKFHGQMNLGKSELNKAKLASLLLDLLVPLKGRCVYYDVLIGGRAYSIPQTYLTLESLCFRSGLQN